MGALILLAVVPAAPAAPLPHAASSRLTWRHDASHAPPSCPPANGSCSPNWAGYVDDPSGLNPLPATTVAASSDGQPIDAGTLNVVTTDGFPASGQLYVETYQHLSTGDVNRGSVILAYASKSDTSFDGVTVFAGNAAFLVKAGAPVTVGPQVTSVSATWDQPAVTCPGRTPTTTIGSESNNNGVDTPFLFVASTAAFPSSGSLSVTTRGGSTVQLSYTQKTAREFKGVKLQLGNPDFGVGTGGAVTLGVGDDLDIWPGMDGSFGSHSVEQSGTEAMCDVKDKTRVAVASNGTDVGAGVLHVASTAGFPLDGQLSVVTPQGTAVVAYRSTTLDQTGFFVAGVVSGKASWKLKLNDEVKLAGGTMVGSVLYRAWWEMLPDAPGYFSSAAVPVKPGDQITATVRYVDSTSAPCADGTFTLAVTNDTDDMSASVVFCGGASSDRDEFPKVEKGKGFINGASCSADLDGGKVSDCTLIPPIVAGDNACPKRPNACQRGTAEWIVERSGGAANYALAKFGTATLGDADFSLDSSFAPTLSIKTSTPTGVLNEVTFMQGATGRCCLATAGKLTNESDGGSASSDFQIKWLSAGPG